MPMKRLFKDEVMANAAALALVSFLEALQALIVIALIFSFIPIPAFDFVKKLFPLSLYDVRPEREMFFYRLAVLTAIGLQAILTFVFRAQLSDGKMRWKLYPFAAVSGFWAFVQVFAVFKILLWGDPPWARGLLYAGIAGGVLSKVFWPELRRFAQTVYGRIDQKAGLRWPWGWDLGFLGLLGFLLWPGHFANLLGRIFVRDEFYHLDGLFMAPAWAHLNGLALNQDVISQYGIALPIMAGELLKHTVGFDYPAAVMLVMAVTFLYYAALYVFVRQWLNSRALAAFGVLLAIKLQMFHWGVAPLVWQFPTATPLRHWPDIIFFVCLWRHIQTSQPRWLWAAAFTAGFALAWMVDVGVYMLAALLVYVAAFGYQYLRPFSRVVVPLMKMLFIAAGTAFLVFWALQRGTFFHAEFWSNAFEHASLFLRGWGALPMTEGLKDRQFFAFLVGFAVPVVYVFTLIYAGALCLLRKTDFRHIFAVVLSVYGLGLYHYFIHRSGVTSYYAVCVPLVMVICFWISRGLAVLGIVSRRICAGALACAALGALMTGYLFTYYPNVLNLAGFDWKPEKGFYQKEFDFSEDAALIRRLTASDEPVALISSFETKILMQAGRKPFFYYFPLVESAHMNSPEVRGIYLHTYGRMDKTLQDLNQRQPRYIFVEKKLLSHKGRLALGTLLDHVDAHYAAQEQGKYLIAYRRKD
ncbi:MAG: hypothetical protein Q7K71_05955 [Candidatus Omnitrophota bacterium]|nr:hypothetical protein [Candidatus Omnitrophota bacterium]